MEYVSVQGAELPAIGLGTWGMRGRDCYRAVSEGLDAGYRHLDTAENYRNEREVGEALAEADVDRDEVFLTTKVAPQSATDYASTREAARGCLNRLGVDRVDLLLIHWPNPLADLPGQLGALCDLVQEGAVDHVGVSNFNERRLRRARSIASEPILTDQVQFHPFKPQRPLLRYCQDNDVALTAYSPLGHGGVPNDDLLAEIGARYDKSPAQVALRWAIQHRNVCAIPKSSDPEHIRENVDVFDFSMTETELNRIPRRSNLRTGMAWARGKLGV
jgi:diketogulonate reductase-like aldo/keto reductase